MKTGIYKITSPSGKIYVGQSQDIERRFKDYFKYSMFKNQTRLYNSIKKHGVSNHIFEVIEECEFNNLNIRERYWQEFFDVIGPNGLNCQLVNADEKPKVHSQETKDKIRKANTGKSPSIETRAKLSEIAKNNQIGMYWLGKKWSEETKNRFILTRTGQGKKVINIETGEIFSSIKKAADSLNMKSGTLSVMLNGQNPNRTKMEYYAIK